MATSDKVKKVPPVSSKQTIKDRRAAQQQRRQQQQTIVLAIVAVALLVGVLLMVFVSTRPAEAVIPDETLTRYKSFAEAKQMGTTPDGYPYLGTENAPVTIEVVSNFACPHCADYHNSTVVNLFDKVKAGQLKVVFIPLAVTLTFDPTAATKGALCAGQQGKFWEMQETIFSWQTRYGTGAGDLKRIQAAAGNLGLDAGKFNDCLNSAAVKATLDKATEFANKRSVPGTPAVFLDGQMILPAPEGQKSPDLNELRGLIEAKVAAAKK